MLLIPLSEGRTCHYVFSAGFCHRFRGLSPKKFFLFNHGIMYAGVVGLCYVKGIWALLLQTFSIRLYLVYSEFKPS